ncbi:hypothetical protein [Staphylococcus sp. Marseille-Q6910]|uniref:hypothetical protein n=1 Tax=Staphylococcus sp. Marseille-Q6910 TaxID=2937990 RepID=UPI00203EDF8B|nr:hypothetical protein [Staphylococcus sp. Marseille-Q6910]
MKKKVIGILATVSLTFTLGACGQQNNVGDNNKQNSTTMSDILNSKSDREIVMVNESTDSESPKISWAGTIGKGKIDLHPYEVGSFKDGKDFTFDSVKNLNLKEFKEKLKEQDNNYQESDSNGNDIKIQTGKVNGKIILHSADGKETQSINLDFNTKNRGSVEDKDAMVNPEFSEIKGKQEGWLAMSTNQEEDPSTIMIKAKKDEKSLDFENVKKAKKEYKNVEVVK